MPSEHGHTAHDTKSAKPPRRTRVAFVVQRVVGLRAFPAVKLRRSTPPQVFREFARLEKVFAHTAAHDKAAVFVVTPRKVQPANEVLVRVDAVGVATVPLFHVGRRFPEAVLFCVARVTTEREEKERKRNREVTVRR